VAGVAISLAIMNTNKKLKILLVEDSQTDATLLQESIFLSGTNDISVTVAASLQQAANYCKNNRFDAALLDLTLPDSAGLETVRLAMKHCPDMPIVVLTGIDDEQIGVEAVRMGVQDYLVKGQTDGRSIVRAIRYSIERKRLEEELRKAHDKLEQRVKERTSELADALVALQDQMEEREKIQNALIDSELKYRELVENANSIIMRCNVDGTITFFNEFAQKFFGFSEKEIIGRNIIGTIAPRTDSAGRDLEAIVAKISKNPEAYQNFESENMCRDGRRVWVNWANRPIKGADGRVIEVLSVGNDITYRKQAEAKIQEYDSQLRSLTAELVLVEEDERRKIAEALHDSIGPLLAFSERELGNLQKFVTKEVSLALDEVKHHINDAVKQTRSLTFDLSPSSLYDLGFEDAVEELAEQFSNERNLKFSFKNSDEPKPLTEEAKILLYRSIRELLVNIAKHADAKTVSVNLATLNSNIEITIKDNGKGFDTSKLDGKSAKSRGFGLFSIRERLTHIGGRFDIESRKGRGTKVTLLAPLDLAKNK